VKQTSQTQLAIAAKGTYLGSLHLRFSLGVCTEGAQLCQMSY
jgi:hypothetical protein